MKTQLRFTVFALLLSLTSLGAQTAHVVFAQDFTKGLIGVNIDAAGNIWATENGSGNDDGQITIIDSTGKKTLFMTGLPSTFIQAAGEIVGSYRTYQLPDNKVLIVVGEGTNKLSETLLIVDKTKFKGTPLTLADVEKVIEHGKFIHGLGFVQSNPFNVDWDKDGNIFIADSGANSIVKWHKGVDTFSIVKTIDRFANPFPYGPPMVDPVPTKALRYSDTTFYVSQLTGFPFVPGAAKVYSLNTNGTMRVHAEGFTCLTDMSIDPLDGNLCVIQFGVFGDVGGGMLNFKLGSAAVIKIMPDGSRDTIAQNMGGLSPSFTFDGKGNLYVTDLVFGQILKYSLLTSNREIPQIKALSKAYPNPAQDQVNIEYEILQAAPVTIGIYDLSGRQVATYQEGKQVPGKYLFQWKGVDSKGQGVPSGMYMYRVLAGRSQVSGLVQMVR